MAPPTSVRAPELKARARPPLYVPENAKIQQALALFQRQKFHLGIVVDEYGGTSGLLPLEEIPQELIGETPDEFGQEAAKGQRQPHRPLVLGAGPDHPPPRAPPG